MFARIANLTHTAKKRAGFVVTTVVCVTLAIRSVLVIVYPSATHRLSTIVFELPAGMAEYKWISRTEIAGLISDNGRPPRMCLKLLNVGKQYDDWATGVPTIGTVPIGLLSPLTDAVSDDGRWVLYSDGEAWCCYEIPTGRRRWFSHGQQPITRVWLSANDIWIDVFADSYLVPIQRLEVWSISRLALLRSINPPAHAQRSTIPRLGDTKLINDEIALISDNKTGSTLGVSGYGRPFSEIKFHELGFLSGAYVTDHQLSCSKKRVAVSVYRPPRQDLLHKLLSKVLRRPPDTESFECWICDLDGGNPICVGSQSSNSFNDLMWLPDDKAISYLVGRKICLVKIHD